MRQEFDYAGDRRPAAVVIVCAWAGASATSADAARIATHL